QLLQGDLGAEQAEQPPRRLRVRPADRREVGGGQLGELADTLGLGGAGGRVAAGLEHERLEGGGGAAGVEVGGGAVREPRQPRREGRRGGRDGGADVAAEALVDGGQEGGAVGEVDVEGALGDPGGGGHLVDGGARQPTGRGHLGAGVEKGVVGRVG